MESLTEVTLVHMDATSDLARLFKNLLTITARTQILPLGTQLLSADTTGKDECDFVANAWRCH
jgi:hypothetical protein